jgi:hypothetical protein
MIKVWNLFSNPVLQDKLYSGRIFLPQYYYFSFIFISYNSKHIFGHFTVLVQFLTVIN